MNETLILNQHTNTYEGDSPTQRKHISIAAAAMAAAGRIGRSRAETNIHFFAQIMSADFWLRDAALLALPGVTVTETLPSD